MNKFHVGAGALVYWNLGQETDPQTLCDGLRDLGLDVKTPEGRSWQMSLKAAMSKRFNRSEEMVRPLKNKAANGYVVVVEQKGEDGNTYTNTVKAKVSKDGVVEVNRSWELCEELQKLTEHYHALLPSSDVSELLVGIINGLDGTAMRDCGPPYFIPQDGLPVWQSVRRVVKRSATNGSENNLTTVPFEFNADTLRDVQIAVTRQMRALSDKLMNELTENDLGPRAIANRIETCCDAVDRLTKYEQLIGGTLDDCRGFLRDAVQALAHAQAAKDCQDFAGELLECA